MDSYKSRTYEIDYEKTVLDSSILKYKDIFVLLKDSQYSRYINSTLQIHNLKWVFPALSTILLLEMITSYKRLEPIFKTDLAFRVLFITAISIQFIFGVFYVQAKNEKKYKSTYNTIIHGSVFHFIIFQIFFYLAGAIEKQSFFYFVTTVAAIAIFPTWHTKSAALFIGLNNLIFLLVVHFYYVNYSITSIVTNAFYISVLGISISFHFFYSKVSLLVNSKKISMFAKEMAIANDQLNYFNEELEKISFTDTLTNISNRRAYETEIEKMWGHQMRSGSPISIMMLDVDFFKDYNDYFGHQEGDNCLASVASCLKACFKRKSDIVARFGGEEFVVAFPSLGEEEASSMAQKTLEAIRELKIEHPKSQVYPYVTLSIGVVTTVPSKGVLPEEILNVADKALYQAKATGRNKFCSDSFFPGNIKKEKRKKLGLVSDSVKLREIIKALSICRFSQDYKTKKVEFSNEILNYLNMKTPFIEFPDEFEKFIHADDLEKFRKAINSFYDSDFDKTSVEFRIIQKNGIPLWVKLNSKLLKKPDGTPDEIIGSIIDIDELITNKNVIEELTDGFYHYDFIRDSGEVNGKIINYITDNEKNYMNIAEFYSYLYDSDKDDFLNLIEDIEDLKELEFRIKKDENIHWVSCRNYVRYNASGEPYSVVGLINDLDRFKTYNKNIKKEFLANPVSGLPGRARFEKDLKMILNENDSNGYVYFIDIDSFNDINNIFDYQVGDNFLNEVSQRIAKNKIFDGRLYHFEGDLFAIIFPNISLEDLEKQIKEFDEIITEPIECRNTKYKFSFSSSSIKYPDFGKEAGELIRNNDLALKKVKSTKKGGNIIFTKALFEENLIRLKLEMQLRNSIDNNMEGFLIYYHPLLSADDGVCIGAEALLRWVNEEGKMINPLDFIPCLEETGMMNKVGDWVLKTASRQCKKWLDTGILVSDNEKYRVSEKFSININISSNQLIEDNFEKNLIEYLDKLGLEHNRVVLELTESALLLDMKKGIDVLDSLRTKGIKIAIDDFGTGYSSLSYFRDLPVDEIKIDKSFINDIENDSFSREFVNSIIKITQSVDRLICVEGVENEFQAEILKNFNANILQGFLFSKPIPNDEFEKLFLKNDNTA